MEQSVVFRVLFHRFDAKTDSSNNHVPLALLIDHVVESLPLVAPAGFGCGRGFPTDRCLGSSFRRHAVPEVSRHYT